MHGQRGLLSQPDLGRAALASADGQLRAHPLVRIHPDDGEIWVLARTDRRRAHRVSSKVAAIVVRCFEPATIRDLESLAGEPGDGEQVTRIVKSLLASEYLCSGATDGQDEAAARGRWSLNGWRAAADYHLQTFGYPFEHYEPDGTSAEDLARMRAYNRAEPDTDRAKGPPAQPKETYQLPEVGSALADAPAADAVGRACTPGEFERNQVLSLLSLATRPVGLARTPFPEAAPVLRKTSPSGGSRHPTELYVCADGISGLATGWYHVAVLEGQLSALPVSGSMDDGLRFASLPRPSGPSLLVVYASFWRRNRYRYREPRTFRTVHMDAGHLMTTVEFLGAGYGLRVRHSSHVDARGLATLLGLEPLVEAPISATMIDRREPT